MRTAFLYLAVIAISLLAIGLGYYMAGMALLLYLAVLGYVEVQRSAPTLPRTSFCVANCVVWGQRPGICGRGCPMYGS